MAQRVYNFHATEATRESILLRAAICGPTGSGKTKTGLVIGTRMVERLGLGPLYVIDSENKSALRYAYSPRSRQGYRFKHVPMPEDDYGPAAYMAALDFCESQGAGVILIDSLSHAWNGINGVLEQVDQVTERSRSKNAFSEGWKAMTPVHNRLIQRILGSSAHIDLHAARQGRLGGRRRTSAARWSPGRWASPPSSARASTTSPTSSST